MATIDITQYLKTRTTNNTNPLTGSVHYLSDPDIKEAFDRSKVEWQKKAWALYDLVPEIKFAVEYFANSIAQAKIIVGKIEEGRVVKADNETVLNIGESILSKMGDTHFSQSEFLRITTQNLKVAGEVWVISDFDEDGEEIFKLYSSKHVSYDTFKDQISVKKYDKEQGRKIDAPINPETQTAFRIYRAHPDDQLQPTSNIRSIIPEGETLLRLDRLVRATAHSKIHAGVMAVPNEIDFGKPANVASHESGYSKSDPLQEQIFEALSEPISDEGSASTVVPMVMRGPAEFLDKVRHLALGREFDQLLPELQEKYIRRIATGIDMPAALLLGQQDSTHWTAWHFSADFVRSHAVPTLSLICDSLTVSVLHGLLRRNNVEDFKDYCFWFDETMLVQQPNKTANAIDAYKLGALSKTAFLHHLGFSSSEASDDDVVPGTPRTSEGVQPDRPFSGGVQPDQGEDSPAEEVR